MTTGALCEIRRDKRNDNTNVIGSTPQSMNQINDYTYNVKMRSMREGLPNRYSNSSQNLGNSPQGFNQAFTNFHMRNNKYNPGSPYQNNIFSREHTMVKRGWKSKDPDLYDVVTTEWTDHICHFGQVSAWNEWSESEKAAQLSMSLRVWLSVFLVNLTLARCKTMRY